MFQSRRAAVGSVLLIAFALPAAVTAAPPHVTVTAFAMAADALPFGVTAGPRGEWVSLDTRIGRFDEAGHLTTESIPSDGANAGWLTSDPSGSIWISERDTGKMGRVSPSGSITEFPLPAGPDAVPQGSVVAPGGDLYVTEQGANAIARLDPRTGHVTEFAVPTPDSTPLGLTLGPDGALWFTERSAAQIGRMTLGGDFREWPLDPGAFPNRIVTGPDRAVWFTELRAGMIGRISMDGTLTEFPISGGPVGITVGRDGELDVVLTSARQVARVNLHGTVTGTWDLPGALGPLQIATGRGHDLWVTDNTANMVFRLAS